MLRHNGVAVLVLARVVIPERRDLRFVASVLLVSPAKGSDSGSE